jgi:hypothetical protein
MRTGRCAGVLTIVAVLVLLLAAQSPAETITVHGHLSRGPGFQLVVDGGGHVQQGTFKWNAHCRRTHGLVSTASGFTLPASAPVGHFAVKGRYRARSHGFRFINYIAIRGHDRPFVPSVARLPRAIWKGKFKAKVRVIRHGHLIDRCSTGKHRWLGSGGPGLGNAGSGTFEASGDPSVGGGGSFTAPPSSFETDGYGNELNVVINGQSGWVVNFIGPYGAPLHVGTYAVPAGSDSMKVWQADHPCSGPAGQFTVNSVAYDRYYAMRSADISFQQYCITATPLVGRIVVTRPECCAKPDDASGAAKAAWRSRPIRMRQIAPGQGLP